MEKIGIVGGGLAGSLMAVYFAKRGMEVHVFERRPDMRNTEIPAGRSINLALSVRGITALSKVGLDKEVLEQAIPMLGRMMHDRSGELAYQPYGKDGQYINSVSRGHLNIRLLELADENENVTLYFNHKCTEVDLENAKAVFEDEHGNTNEFQGDWLIGADGAYSAVRMEMQTSGRFNYSQDYLEHGYKELSIPPTASGEFAMDPDALHIWPRGEYMMIALPNPDKTFTCTLFYPYHGKNSFDSIQTPEDVKQFFNEEFPDAVPLMPHLVEDFFENPTGSLVTVRCSPWVRGKTALLGDACHAVVPFYGQGMNCAFEDCYVLDQCLEKHLPDLGKAMSEYEKLRINNANAIADLALQNFIEMRDLVADEDFLRFKAVEHELCELYPEHFKSQYELVTFTNEPYEHALKRGAQNSEMVHKLIASGNDKRMGDREFMLEFFKQERSQSAH
jgi:kynurenine 3-monooxygenase